MREKWIENGRIPPLSCTISKHYIPVPIYRALSWSIDMFAPPGVLIVTTTTAAVVSWAMTRYARSRWVRVIGCKSSTDKCLSDSKFRIPGHWQWEGEFIEVRWRGKVCSITNFKRGVSFCSSGIDTHEKYAFRRSFDKLYMRSRSSTHHIFWSPCLLRIISKIDSRNHGGDGKDHQTC